MSQYWPKENNSFFDIDTIDNNFLVNIKWSRKQEEDYFRLAENYILCAYKTCENIVESGNANGKCDMWILPGIYMFRQGIELAIKALICRSIDLKPEIQKIFLNCKHDLYRLFKEYKEKEKNYLQVGELDWLLKYLKDLEYIDKNSDLFRYPFDDKFLDKYGNSFLDIVDMCNNIRQSCLLIIKCIEKGNKNINFDKNRIPKFLMFADNGIGNFHLWKDFIDPFGRSITAYSEVSRFLFLECEEISNEKKAYPLLFLLRNLIELELKQIFYRSTKIKHGVKKEKFDRKRKSHILYKELWMQIEDTIGYYNNSKGQEPNTINIVKKQLEELSKIDKNGDTFRYPASYSFEYKFDNQCIDLRNIFSYMNGIANFLDGYDGWLADVCSWEHEEYYY